MRNAIRFSSRAPTIFFEDARLGKKAEQVSVLKLRWRANAAR
jgi:lipopolysaccharide/colanic/teichoic acid biosynthesis glycosyltransferase